MSRSGRATGRGAGVRLVGALVAGALLVGALGLVAPARTWAASAAGDPTSDQETAPPDTSDPGAEAEAEASHDAAHAAGTASSESPGLHWFAIPNVGFDTDDGPGVGARAELNWKEAGYTPYRVAYVLQAYLTTRGYHHHRFRYDRTGFGPDGRLRFTMHIAWRQWLNDRYFGVGNATVREHDAPEARYIYSLFQPFSHNTLRIRIDGPWSAFTALSARWSRVRAKEGSLLGAQRPFGIDGGFTGELHGGVLYDTRFPERNPERGVLLELSGRYAPPLDDGTGHFGGVLASARGFVKAGRRVILGARVAGEGLVGRVPFYEYVHWGGSWPVAGFGGSETLRGVVFGRWRGPGKVILNTEARVQVHEWMLGSHPLAWLLVPFADAGLAFGTGEQFDDAGPASPFHPTVGLGSRVLYDRSFVGRMDVGVGVDSVRQANGGLKSEPSLGIYIVFDHTF